MGRVDGIRVSLRLPIPTQFATILCNWYINGPDLVIDTQMNDMPANELKLNKNDVFLQLRKSISEGDFQPGERLPAERELAQRFGVARGTLREGLRELEKSGMVERRQGSGTYVTYDTQSPLLSIIESVRPLELVDSRLALEPHICRKAVLHATDADFRQAELLLKSMESCNDDPIEFSKYDEEFHQMLAEWSGNRLMQWMAQSMSGARAHSQWARVRTITLTPDIITTYNLQHRAIIDAIRSREPEVAAAQMKKHIMTARESLQNIAEV